MATAPTVDAVVRAAGPHVGPLMSRIEERLAAVTTQAEVDDVRSEWEDRYGPVPEPADALLNVGYLRAECHRLGLRDVSIAASQARLAPLTLKTSVEMRLQRLVRGAIYKPDSQQLVVPIAHNVEPAEFLVAFLRELIPQ